MKERADILLNIPVYGAVRDGDFCNDFFPFLKEKHKQLGVNEHGKLGFAALVTHSADGCKHNTGKKDVPIITCSEQLYSLEVQKKDISTANSCQLFTYLQVQSEEKRDIIVPMFKDYIELKNKFLENAKDYLGNNCPVFCMSVTT